MPRLSLYRPEKGKDYKFIDRTVYEMFQVGGVDVFVHKYVGPQDPTDPSKALGETTIQDVLFLENRDRKYDPDIYVLRGHYQTQDIDFNLSQFGLFLQNDTVFLTVHINNSVDTIGRKLMPGDVIELPNLKDDYALNDFAKSLKRFYVIEDINRAAEGFSAVWYPHLYRIKLKPIVDSQEFKDILDRPMEEDTFAGDWDETKTYVPGQIVKYQGILYEVTQESTGHQPPNADYYVVSTTDTLRDLMSTYNKELAINQGVIAEAEADAAKSGYETQHFYTIARDDSGNVAVTTSDTTTIDTTETIDASSVTSTPLKDGYKGYLLGDGVPPNGEQFGFGIKFPTTMAEGDFFLRTDYLPNRLFRYNGKRWVKYEDSVRMTLTNTDDRQTQKGSFINNTEQTLLGAIGTDVIRVADPYTPESGSITSSFDLMTNKVITTIPFDAKYGVGAWLGENKINVTVFEESNCVAFTTNTSVTTGDQLRYTVYREKVDQRQSLSKALRPKADF